MNETATIERELYDRNERRRSYLETLYGSDFATHELVITNEATGERRRLVNRPAGFVDESEPTIRPALLGRISCAG